MKRILSLVLVLLLVCSVALAESVDINTIAGRNAKLGYPVVEEPLSVSIAVQPQSSSVDFKAENNWMCQYLDRYTGLDIEWMVLEPTSANERITMMLNAGDFPDTILGHGFNSNAVVQYGMSDELFRPINDLLDYTPRFKELLDDEQTRSELVAPDGNIYGFPAFYNIYNYGGRMFINTKWLKNVGLELPKTLEEFKTMLIAFRDQDANGNGDTADEIPWCASWNHYGGSDNIMMAFGLISKGNIAINYNEEDPVIVYKPYTKEYKDYLLYMNDLWTENLIDPDIFTQDALQVQADVTEGIGGYVGMDAPSVYDPDHEADWEAIPALVAEEGKTPVYAGMNKINSPAKMILNIDIEDEKAIALAKMADAFYTVEWYSMVNRGPEAGTEMDWNNNGYHYDPAVTTEDVTMDFPDNMPSLWVHLITNITIWEMPGFNLFGSEDIKNAWGELYPETAFGKQYLDGAKTQRWEASMNSQYVPYYVAPVPTFYMSAEDVQRVGELTTPLDDYVATMEAKFITGELDIEANYDEFIATLQGYGVDELVEIYTGYYEAYKAN